jgi:hypothetical protein
MDGYGGILIKKMDLTEMLPEGINYVQMSHNMSEERVF